MSLDHKVNANVRLRVIAVAIAGILTAPTVMASAPSPSVQQEGASGAAGQPKATVTKTAAEKQRAKQTTLQTIQVVGTVGALMRAQVTKENALGIVDSISAEEAGKFPDQTVAGALQRVPGVSVNRGNDETNQITVRGFGPEFNTTLVDGREMASATGSRAFNFDTLPVELLQQAVVHKTSSADVVSGGIGATIDIHTWQPLEFNGFHADGTFSSSYSDIPGEVAHRKATPKVSGMIGDTNSDHTFGWLIAAQYYKNDESLNQLNTGGWLKPGYPLLGEPEQDASIPQQTDYFIGSDTQTSKAFNGAVEWSPVHNLTLTANYLYTELNSQYHFNMFGLFENPGAIDSLQQNAQGTATQFTENTSGALSDDEMATYGPSDERDTLGGLNARYQIDDNNTIDLDLSSSRAWDKTAALGYWTVLGTRNFGVTPTFHNDSGGASMPYYTNILIPAEQVNNLFAHFDEFGKGESGNGGQENATNGIREAQLNFEHDFDNGIVDSIRAGVAETRNSIKTIDFVEPNSFECAAYCGYIASVPASAVDAHVQYFGPIVGKYFAGGPTSWVVYNPYMLFQYLATPAAYDQLPPATAAALERNVAANGGFTARPIPGDFSYIRERDDAGYVMANLSGNIGPMPWQGQVGVRYTHTSTLSQANSVPLLAIGVNPLDKTNAIPSFGTLSPIQARGHYHEWLPSLSFRLNVLPKVVLRFAASRTLSRPTIGDLSAATSYNFRPSNQQVSKGNTDLQPYLSTNIDLGGEYYYGAASYVSLDLFHKKVENFDTVITTLTTILGFPFQLTQPVNLNTAVIKGAEATWNQQLSFLPSPFDGLGFALNYTYVTSSASITAASLAAGSKFAVPGIGDSYNAVLYYQKGRWDARFAYNWRGNYLTTIAGAQGLPTRAQTYGELDFSGSYRLSKHAQLFIDALNINNEMIYQYQVYPDQASMAEADGRTLLVGVHMSL